MGIKDKKDVNIRTGIVFLLFTPLFIIVYGWPVLQNAFVSAGNGRGILD